MIYLASNSPRRRELLQQIHVHFEPLLFRGPGRNDHDIAEDVLPGEDAVTYVQRVANAKATGGIQRMRWRELPQRLLLAADTTLELDGEIIGKPDDGEHAVAILQRLSGRVHRVLTAVVVSDGLRFETRLSTSEVRFRPLSEDEIRYYVATGEADDKAGAYGIQGRAALFIEEIRGSYTGIMGLPLFETGALLQEFGYSL
ncbi:nucleoside triphosphate pyrophosphatase [Zoogloea sp. 1C4]|uniref:Maf family protein n=1 Tax=Zoogloea sp. 1C4 TaxID=2570190 RepID=UPI001292102C|nr:Maf family protein [Zoogloea sp. 1C4]